MAPQDAQRNQPSQENLLLDYVHRLEKHKGGRKAVHVHLSALRPFNRREHHVRVAAGSFENMIKALQGQLFTLKSSDLFFVYKVEAEAEAQNAVQRVRFLFSDDPLLTEEETEQTRFSTWYDVEKQFDELLYNVQGLVAEEQKRESKVRAELDTRAALKARQEQGEPLTPDILARVETALVRADLSNLMRRQYICELTPKGAPEPAFSEMFISIKDLRETLLPGVNLTANRWLFQYLTQTLDLRMLSLLGKTDQISITGDVSFNINVSTLLSPDFLSFDDNVPAARRGAMVVELQTVDIFADLGAYLFAREFIQERGYRVCIDGLTYETMPMIDRERLGADFVKLVWDSDLVDKEGNLGEKVRSMVRRTGEGRVVLCRCDNREAIDFGMSVGIGMFQGRHVETLIAEDNRRRELMRLKRRMQRS